MTPPPSEGLGGLGLRLAVRLTAEVKTEAEAADAWTPQLASLQPGPRGPCLEG